MYKDDRKMETVCDTVGVGTGHGLVSTGNIEVREISSLWPGLCELYFSNYSGMLSKLISGLTSV